MKRKTIVQKSMKITKNFQNEEMPQRNYREDEGSNEGFGVSVDASRFFSDERERWCVWVERGRRVGWLAARLRRRLRLSARLALLGPLGLLHPHDPLALLQPADTIRLIPVTGEWFDDCDEDSSFSEDEHSELDISQTSRRNRTFQESSIVTVGSYTNTGIRNADRKLDRDTVTTETRHLYESSTLKRDLLSVKSYTDNRENIIEQVDLRDNGQPVTRDEDAVDSGNPADEHTESRLQETKRRALQMLDSLAGAARSRSASPRVARARRARRRRRRARAPRLPDLHVADWEEAAPARGAPATAACTWSVDATTAATPATAVATPDAAAVRPAAPAAPAPAAPAPTAPAPTAPAPTAPAPVTPEPLGPAPRPAPAAPVLRNATRKSAPRLVRALC